MNLKTLFNAQSIAVIGASKDDKKRGYQAIRTLLEGKYEGDIYPVNPKLDKVLGLSCYPSISAIGKPIDLALITTPAGTIPGLLKECGENGVAGVVIIAGGFGELGAEGKKLQSKITAMAQKHNVRMIGPNTSGIINAHNNMDLVGLGDIPKGDIALISQSGNMALALITEAALKSQKGFSYYVGVGNEADVKFHEYLKLFTDDPNTKAILMYVEGMSDGRKFLQQAYNTSSKKPIILLKSGRSTKGAKSAGSHTGVLAGISEVARTAFLRAGIITIENSDELFPVAEALSNLPPMKNNRVAILADGGGHATIAADILTDLGVEIPRLKKCTREKLKEVLSPNASLANPIDVAGSTDADPGVFADCSKILLEDDNIDALLIVGLFGGYGIRFSDKLKFIEEDASHRMGKLVKSTGKPIILHSLYNYAHPHSLDLLRYYNIPVHDSLDISCKCISSLSNYGKYLNAQHAQHSFVFEWGRKSQDEVKSMIIAAKKEGRAALLEHEAKRLLSLHNAPVLGDILVTSADQAAKALKSFNDPVAMKIVSPDILHKSEAGGVKLNIKTSKDAKDAYGEIIESAKVYKKDADIKGCLVTPMAKPGMEIIIGTKMDPQFGPVVMFGIGGIFVEVLKDVVFRVLPLSKRAAKQMISEIKSAPIFAGFRGKPPIDQGAIADLLVAVSEIITAYPEIKEMDLNPVIVRENGLTIVDARIIL